MDLTRLNALKPPQDVAHALLQKGTDESMDAILTLAQLYRAYIKGWAHMQISPLLRQRFQSSTVVQESLMRIQNQTADFECRSLPEFENYLLKTARTVISDLRRRHLAERRSLRREVPFEELESQAFWNAMRKSSPDTPHTLAADKDEKLDRLEQIRVALLKLPLHYQKIIRAHFEAGHSVAPIALTLSRSPNATRMLLTRALKALQAQIPPDGEAENE